MKDIVKFIPPLQKQAIIDGLVGEEQGYFVEVLNSLSTTIQTAPAIYETDGMDEVKPVLHYFSGNVDVFITEIDKETNQHYGYTSLGLGYFEGGYIELDYIFQELPLLNLDLNFNPETIDYYKKKFEG